MGKVNHLATLWHYPSFASGSTCQPLHSDHLASRSTVGRSTFLPQRHEIASLETFSPSLYDFLSSLQATTDRKGGEGSLKGDPQREAKKEEIFLTRSISVNEHILFAFPSRSSFCRGTFSKANFTGVRHFHVLRMHRGDRTLEREWENPRNVSVDFCISALVLSFFTGYLR